MLATAYDPPVLFTKVVFPVMYSADRINLNVQFDLAVSTKVQLIIVVKELLKAKKIPSEFLLKILLAIWNEPSVKFPIKANSVSTTE